MSNSSPNRASTAMQPGCSSTKAHPPMAAPSNNLAEMPARKAAKQTVADLDRAREAITFFRSLEDREEDHAPLSLNLIKRIATYTRPYRASRNWLFILTFVRGIQLPLLAWMIGRTINGPIAGHDLRT